MSTPIPTGSPPPLPQYLSDMGDSIDRLLAKFDAKYTDLQTAIDFMRTEINKIEPMYFKKAGGVIQNGNSDTTVQIKAKDNKVASLKVMGDRQGTGIVYVGQNDLYGGGFAYNGDDNPNLPFTTDNLSFFRRSGGVTYEIFRTHPGSSKTYFNDLVYVQNNQRVYAENYHPRADKWTTARKLTLSGDLSGTATFDGSANINIPVTVKLNSHNHTTLTGVTAINFKAQATDLAGIKSTIDGFFTYLDFQIADDVGDGFRWCGRGVPLMQLKLKSAQGKADLEVHGAVIAETLQATTIKATGDVVLNGAHSKLVVRNQVYVQNNQRVYAENYHPRADKWTTARKLTLSGDLSGTATFDGSANINIPVTVKLNGHNHTSLTDVTAVNFKAAASDFAGIKPTIAGASTYLDCLIASNAGDGFRWLGRRSSTYAPLMQLKLKSAQGKADLEVHGAVIAETLQATGDVVLNGAHSKLVVRNQVYVQNNQRVYAENYHPRADKWTTARKLTLSGDLSGTATFDGSANINIPVTVKLNSHNHTSLTDVTAVNFKAAASDFAGIKPTIAGARTYLDCLIASNAGDGFRWLGRRSSTYAPLMQLKLKSAQGKADLEVHGAVIAEKLQATTVKATGDVVLNGANSQLFVARQNDTSSGPTIDLAIGDKDTGLNWHSGGVYSLVSNTGNVATVYSDRLNVHKLLNVLAGISFGDNDGLNIKGDDINFSQDGINVAGLVSILYDKVDERSALQAGVLQAHNGVKAKSYDFHTGNPKQAKRSAGMEYNAKTKSIDFVFD